MELILRGQLRLTQVQGPASLAVGAELSSGATDLCPTPPTPSPYWAHTALWTLPLPDQADSGRRVPRSLTILLGLAVPIAPQENHIAQEMRDEATRSSSPSQLSNPCLSPAEPVTHQAPRAFPHQAPAEGPTALTPDGPAEACVHQAGRALPTTWGSSRPATEITREFRGKHPQSSKGKAPGPVLLVPAQ